MSTPKPPIRDYLYPNRSATLVLLGVSLVIAGCLSGMMALLMVAVTFLGRLAPAPQGPQVTLKMMIPSILLYLGIAVMLICLGIGLARARRWAWTLSVVLAWMWLIVGVLAFFMYLFLVAPMMMKSVAQQPNVPREVILAMMIVGAVFSGCIYIVLPGVFLAFCHREQVRATVWWRDRKTQWTDRCPRPVLAVSILMALSVVSLPALMAYGGVVPLFGVIVSGPAGWAVLVLMALLLAYLAWGTYRLQMAAWWLALLLGIAWAVSVAVTFARTDLMQMYEKMDMPEEQLELIRKSGMVESMSRGAPWMALVSGVAWVGYMLYVRRYFVHGRKEQLGNSDKGLLELDEPSSSI